LEKQIMQILVNFRTDYILGKFAAESATPEESITAQSPN